MADLPPIYQTTTMIFTLEAAPPLLPTGVIRALSAAIIWGHGPSDIAGVSGVALTIEESLLQADAIALTGDSITAVRSAAEILAWAGPHAHVVDPGGRRPICCSVHSHTHLLPSMRTPESAQRMRLP